MSDLVERKLEMLFRDLKPYADKPLGSLRIGMDEVRVILALEARITALETALAEAEGRVIADVVKWLREKARDDYTGAANSLATALETGEWKK